MKAHLFKILLLTLMLMEHIFGYCVYNDYTDDTELYVYQLSATEGSILSHFRKDHIKPGKKECCSYTNGDCSESSDPDSELLFAARQYFPRYTNLFFDFTAPAGGSITFSGTEETHSMAVYFANGTAYPYKYLIDQGTISDYDYKPPQLGKSP